MGKCYRIVLVFVGLQFFASQVLPAVVECVSTPEGHCTREACPHKSGSGEDGTHHHESKSASVTATCSHHRDTHSGEDGTHHHESKSASVTATCSHHGDTHSAMAVPSDLPHSSFELDTSWQLVSFLYVSTPGLQAGHLRYDLPPPRISSSRI